MVLLTLAGIVLGSLALSNSTEKKYGNLSYQEKILVIQKKVAMSGIEIKINGENDMDTQKFILDFKSANNYANIDIELTNKFLIDINDKTKIEAYIQFKSKLPADNK